MSRRDRDPGALSPRNAVERYLRRRRADSTDASVEAWKYRLKLFVEWCEGIGIERVDQLQPYDLDEYYEIRSGSVAPATLEGEMWTLTKFFEYLEQLDAVDEGISEKVRIPNLDKEDRADDTSLVPESAFPLLQFYRNSEQARATRAHAMMELLWYTGARQGGVRALDVRDVHFDSNYVEFHHRPNTDTPLKNKRKGERPVALPPEVMDVLREYLETDRYDTHDDHSRQPFLASAVGRPKENTLRVWTYRATQPCLHSPCPHDKVREACKFTKRAHASKCPSSRSPHKIRTGSITWQLNLGFPPEVVAERVNATVKTIEQHYDWASAEERWRRRRDRMENRREYIERLDFTTDETDNDD